MLNRTILMGRLVADPELKTTASGISVTSFTIAVDRNYVKDGEERKADFIGIVCWRHTAEFVCRYFSKGSLIAVEGQLQSRTYQAKDGTNRYVVEVVADNVSFTGERRDKGNNGNSSSQQQNTPQNNQNGYPNANSGYDNPPQQFQQANYNNSYNNNGNGYNAMPPEAEEYPLDDDLPF